MEPNFLGHSPFLGHILPVPADRGRARRRAKKVGGEGRTVHESRLDIDIKGITAVIDVALADDRAFDAFARARVKRERGREIRER